MNNSGSIKILEVCTVETSRSGIPNVIFNQMENFNSDKFELGYVAINNPSEYYKMRLKNIGARLYIIPRKLSNPFKYIFQLTQIARGYDIIHVHGNSATMTLEMLAALMAGVKVKASHCHSSDCNMKVIDKLCRPIFHSICNLRFSCSEVAAKWLYGNRKNHIIRNGISIDRFKFNSVAREKLRNELRLDNKFVITNVANFDLAKNHPFLIEIFGHLIHQKPEARLMLIGAGPEMQGIKSLVIDKRLDDKVIFAGSVSNPEDYMSASDIIVMPSFNEGFPLTLVEEQANGLSAIIADTISRQVNLSGNVTFLPIEDGAEKWAKKILESGMLVKRDDEVSQKACEKIIEKGYDISTASKHLQKLLIQAVK